MVAEDEEDACSSKQIMENNLASSSQNLFDRGNGEVKKSSSHHSETDAFENDCDSYYPRQKRQRIQKSSNALESLSKKQHRYFFKWSEAQAKTVCNNFSITICDNTDSGSKGSLPGKGEIEKFIRDTDIFLGINISESKKINLVKTKIFNERTKG